MSETENWQRHARLGSAAYEPSLPVEFRMITPSPVADPQAWARAVAALDTDPDAELPL